MNLIFPKYKGSINNIISFVNGPVTDELTESCAGCHGESLSLCHMDQIINGESQTEAKLLRADLV